MLDVLSRNLLRPAASRSLVRGLAVRIGMTFFGLVIWRFGGVVSIRELKKLFFSAPSKRPIDLFGPVANGTILKRLQVLIGFPC